MEGYEAPWQRPEVQMVLNVFNGTVVDIKNIGEIMVNIDNSEDFTNADR